MPFTFDPVARLAEALCAILDGLRGDGARKYPRAGAAADRAAQD